MAIGLPAGRLRPLGGIRGWILPTAFMILIAFVFLVPLYWLVLSSFRQADRIFANAGDFVPSAITLDNFTNLFSEAPFVRWFTNSVILSAGATIGSLVVVTMAAYPLARLRFRGRNAIFFR